MDLEEQIKLTVEGCGVTLYDIATARENNNNIFRIFITSADGISLDICEEVSRMIAPILDINEPMNGKYFLEVSSPGIERKLKKFEHFQASVGELVKGKEYSTEKFDGKVICVDDEKNITFEDSEGDQFTINYDDILSASTYFNF
jgi:ribosome maturation factor RimP